MGGVLDRTGGVASWPLDEQAYFRHGDWNNFDRRTDQLSLMRARKIVDAVLANFTGVEPTS